MQDNTVYETPSSLGYGLMHDEVSTGHIGIR
jgi:hypothetical protein